jgi:hypothetical protein
LKTKNLNEQSEKMVKMFIQMQKEKDYRIAQEYAPDGHIYKEGLNRFDSTKNRL